VSLFVKSKSIAAICLGNDYGLKFIPEKFFSFRVISRSISKVCRLGKLVTFASVVLFIFNTAAA